MTSKATVPQLVESIAIQSEAAYLHLKAAEKHLRSSGRRLAGAAVDKRSDGDGLH
jgi:hypothetical protein